MKINFPSDIYDILLEDAKSKGMSIPKLILIILTTHYNKTSHTKVIYGKENKREFSD